MTKSEIITNHGSARSAPPTAQVTLVPEKQADAPLRSEEEGKRWCPESAIRWVPATTDEGGGRMWRMRRRFGSSFSSRLLTG